MIITVLHVNGNVIPQYDKHKVWDSFRLYMNGVYRQRRLLRYKPQFQMGRLFLSSIVHTIEKLLYRSIQLQKQ